MDRQTNAEWDPDLYLRFKAERTQPSIDLVNRIAVENPRTIVDVGCGPGNSTQILKRRWPDAEIVGIDSSPEMIDKAGRDYPDMTWRRMDARELAAEGSFDVVFSNAVLQWIPNHESLVPGLYRLVKPGGVLAVQVPQNQSSAINRALLDTAASKQFQNYTQDAMGSLHYHTPGFYYDTICQLSDRISMWEISYLHILGRHEELIQWYRSTGMRPFLEKLPTRDLEQAFEAEMLNRCREGYAMQRDGHVLFPFNRLFFLVYRS